MGKIFFRHENGTKTVITKLNTVHNATNTTVDQILGTLVVILLAANCYKLNFSATILQQTDSVALLRLNKK